MTRFLPLLFLSLLPPQEPPDRASLGKALEAKFRSLGIFEAEYNLANMGPDLDRMILNVDLAQRKCLVRIYPPGVKEAQDCRSLYMDGWNIAMWDPKSEPIQIDYGFLMGGFDAKVQSLSVRLERVLGMPGTLEPPIPVFFITLAGKPDKDQPGQFQMGVAIGHGHSASWFGDIAGDKTTATLQAEGHLEYVIAALKKKGVVDKTTGLLRSLETRDYDEHVRRISLTRFVDKSPWPAELIPKKFKMENPPGNQLRVQMSIHFSAMERFLVTARNCWDQVEKDGKVPEVQALVSEWSATAAEMTLAQWVGQNAKNYIEALLKRGDKLGDLRKNGADVAAAFKAWFEGEEDRILENRKAIFKELKSIALEMVAKWTGNGDRVGKIRSAISDALDPGPVEKELKKLNNYPIEKTFVHELENLDR